MTDVETLEECRIAVIEERALSRQIDRLALMCGPRGIGSQALEPAGDRKTNDARAAKLQQLEGLIDRLIALQNENLDIVQQAESVIARIKDRKDRVVIRCYYVEGQSDYVIAEEIEMSQQWVNNRRNQIIERLTMPKKKFRK